MKARPKIGRCLAWAVRRLAELGSTENWLQFALAPDPRGEARTNVFRHLKTRGWVRDANERERREREVGYREVPPRWQLTAAGQRVVQALAAGELEVRQ